MQCVKEKLFVFSQTFNFLYLFIFEKLYISKNLNKAVLTGKQLNTKLCIVENKYYETINNIKKMY